MRPSAPLAALLALSLAGTAVAAADQPTPAVETRNGVVTSFAPVAKRVGPSVVTVFSTKTLKAEDGGGQEIPPQLRRFFGGGALPPGMEDDDHPLKQQGLGSGVIVTPDGYILTNNHVVEGADEVKVGLAGERTEFVAKVVGSDDKSDIAVLKIDPGKHTLSAIAFGDSAKVEVGDVALAVGNPFGIGQTVTQGIISATGRAGLDASHYEDFLQTDAAINRGNSGGALVDIEGRLIGINTAILSPVGTNLGIGFAVPSNFAKSIMDQIIASGKVVRGYLGVVIQPVTDEIAKAWKLSSQDGALVSEVADDGPAKEAGIESGDVVVALNGEKVEDPRHLRLAVAQLKPGAEAKIDVLREGEKKSLTVKIGDLAESDVASRGAKRGPHGGLTGLTGRRGQLGLGLGEVDEQVREQLDIPEKVTGALVVEVRPDSPAAAAGLMRGDVITSINREKVKNPDQAAKLLKAAKDDSIILRVWAKGGSRFAVIEPGKKDE